MNTNPVSGKISAKIMMTGITDDNYTWSFIVDEHQSPHPTPYKYEHTSHTGAFR
jgi:hypothetical protein